MSLGVVTQGVVLWTERFGECVEFYRDVLDLAVWFEKPGLCCFHFGDGYLMVEQGGVAGGGPKGKDRNPAMIRLNVADVEAAAQIVRERGVEVAVQRFDWGTVGTFHDPDGNACEFKNADDPFFARSE